MDNLIITDSKSHGFNCNYGNADLIINNSKITNCDMAPVLILPSYMGKLGTSNDFKGNAEDFIHVALKTDALSGNNSIYNPSVPFRIFQTVSGYAELTINSGVTSFIDPLTVEFTDGTGIAVDENGTIKTSSSLDQILFTGVNKVAGAWRGIYFQFTEGDNILENLVLSYAGATSDNAKSGVQMWANPKLYMADVDFVDIQGCAVLDRPKGAMDPVNPNLTLGGITYTNVSGGNYCKQ